MEKYLTSCLDAILTGGNDCSFEVIAINDASTDDSDIILRDFENRFSNLTVVRFPENKGVSAARNAGLDHARGEYVMFCDPDDAFVPGAIQYIDDLVADSQVDLLFFRHKNVSHQNETVEIGSKIYEFATGKTSSGNAVNMGEKSYLVPFNGGAVTCSSNKNLLPGTGIMITRTSESTEIEYRSIAGDNVELFGFYADKGRENSEIFTYMQNDRITARVSVQTQYFDETGVKYSLAKHYKRANADFAYYEITNHAANPVTFTNTGKPVTYTYFEKSIAGYTSKEDITTKFIINGKEEFERKEK